MSETCATIVATPSHADRKTARPASYATSSASGASRLDSCSTTDDGSTSATFATSASQPCQSGNAYPGWSPPFLNSSTVRSESAPKSSSLRIRPEVEDRVAAHDALDPPQERAEDDAREHDKRRRPARVRSAPGDESRTARPPPRRRDRGRASARASRARRTSARALPATTRDRPGEDGRHAPLPQRAGDEQAGQEQHGGRERETEPEDHNARMTSNRRRSTRPRSRIARAARA